MDVTTSRVPAESTLEAGSSASAGDRQGRGLSAPVVAVDLITEEMQLREDPLWGRGTRIARTLLKQKHLRVVLTVMRAGDRLAEHHTAAAITIQALNGRLRLHLPDRTIVLRLGELVALDQDILHDVEALEDSSFLLTLAWPQPARDAAEDGR